MGCINQLITGGPTLYGGFLNWGYPNRWTVFFREGDDPNFSNLEFRPTRQNFCRDDVVLWWLAERWFFWIKLILRGNNIWYVNIHIYIIPVITRNAMYIYIYLILYIWLVVWNMNFITVHILGIIIPTDFHIFQRGRYTTNQIWDILGLLWGYCVNPWK